MTSPETVPAISNGADINSQSSDLSNLSVKSDPSNASAPSDSEQSAIRNPQSAVHNFYVRLRPFQIPNSKFSRLGTPLSPSWSEARITKINSYEKQLGRRICGARTHAGRPCTLHPNHDNGRCKFHGGFDLTGAPKGNRNAIIHGLYSRRLRQCSPECSQWHQCPCADDEVAELDPADRPICPYEQTEYNCALTDLEATIEHNPNATPYMLHIAHDIALLRVMVNRAAIVLRDGDSGDRGSGVPPANVLKGEGNSGGDAAATLSPLSSNPKSKIQNPKFLSPFLRLFAEYRRSLRLICPRIATEPPIARALTHKQRAYIDTDLTPENTEQIHPPSPAPPTHHELAEKHMNLAREYAGISQGPFAIGEWKIASRLVPENARDWVKELTAVYHPPDDGRLTATKFESVLMESLPPR